MCYNPEQFEGPFCQYDRTQCQRHGGFLCNGTAARQTYLVESLRVPSWALFYSFII